MQTEPACKTIGGFAGKPNFFAKLSGLGTFSHMNDPALIAYVVDHAFGILGSDHLTFGSNFPIEKLWTDHASLLSAYRAAVDPHGPRGCCRHILEHGPARLFTGMKDYDYPSRQSWVSALRLKSGRWRLIPQQISGGEFEVDCL
jgi:predicted TIM-barrel fold metal-dependent hydrolase